MRLARWIVARAIVAAVGLGIGWSGPYILLWSIGK